MNENDARNVIYLFSIALAFLQYFAPSFLPDTLPHVDPPPITFAPTPTLAAPTGILGDSTTIASVSAKVIKVVDGDTIRVLVNNEEKTIRLIGINTPETVDPRREVECFGREASNKAKELLQGQSIYLESDDSQGNTDKYNRLLRYVWLINGISFNERMIAEGYAYEYTYDLPYKYQSVYKRAQLEAQNGKKGLWSDATCNGAK